MPSVTLHTSALCPSTTNPLPALLHTPSGLAILEIQGSIHAPYPSTTSSTNETSTSTQIGRLEFPLYNPADPEGEQRWMKKVYLYVGKHQRLTGEVKKLGKPLAVIGKREGDGIAMGGGEGELEIVEVVRFKVLFAGRPEPVGEEVEMGG